MKKNMWRLPLGRMLALAQRQLCLPLVVAAALNPLSAQAESASAVNVETTRNCGLSNYSTPIDCSSYETVFAGVDAFCKGAPHFEAYLAAHGSSGNALTSYEYDKISCRDDRYPIGVNSGWEGGYLRVDRALQCGGAGWSLKTPDNICVKTDAKPQACLLADGGLSGNPIAPASAEKLQTEADWIDTGEHPLSFVRTYRSAPSAVHPVRQPLGANWSFNHAAEVKVGTDPGTTHSVTLIEGGSTRVFVKSTVENLYTPYDGDGQLTRTPSGWTLKRPSDDATLQFDAAGRLQSQIARNGWSTTYTYNAAGQLATLTNVFGRTLTLGYNSAGQLTSVSAPDGRVITYGYDTSNRLWRVSDPDGKTRTYVYENTSFPNALTGILDETGARFASFGYDAQGRATSTEHAGTTNRYQVSYPYVGSASVVDPLGTTRTYSYGTAQGRLAVTGGFLPSATGEPDAASRVQDANGLITRETDFKGVVTTITWDVARRLPTSVTRAYGTPEAQTVTTVWHPTFSLPTLITEMGRTTSFTYDTLGNVLAQTVTDTVTSKSLTWKWSYNTQGLVASTTDSNGAVTVYTYDTAGNLTKARNTNAGLETSYLYDSANRVISTTAANGLITTYTWDARDRLLTLAYNPLDDLTQAKDFKGVATLYARDAQGNATGETSADVGVRKTEYDSLGLPSKIVDALGQATTITRDALGRPTSLTFTSTRREGLRTARGKRCGNGPTRLLGTTRRRSRRTGSPT